MTGERVLMKALARQVYDGQMLFIGSTFAAAAEQVRELEALGLACRAQNSHTPPPPTESEAKRGRYRRRDLRPDE